MEILSVVDLGDRQVAVFGAPHGEHLSTLFSPPRANRIAAYAVGKAGSGKNRRSAANRPLPPNSYHVFS